MSNLNFKKTIYCPHCNRKVHYTISHRKITQFKGVKLDVTENVAVCCICKNTIFYADLERENLISLYAAYKKITGVDPQKSIS